MLKNATNIAKVEPDNFMLREFKAAQNSFQHLFLDRSL